MQFNPRMILISTTFDIDVYQKVKKSTSLNGIDADLQLTYQLKDCRLSNYSFSFAPATLLQENVAFMCLQILDRAEATDKLAQASL